MSKQVTLDKFFKPTKRQREDAVPPTHPPEVPPREVLSAPGDPPHTASATPHTLWDDRYVRMPFSPANIYTSHGKQRSVWAKIVAVMRTPILTPLSLVTAIQSVAGQPTMDLGALYLYLEKMDNGVRVEFFTKILPWMQSTLLRMPELFATHPVPLLPAGTPGEVTLDGKQIESLLVAMFFCVMPDRSRLPRYKVSEACPYAKNYPTLNMNTLFGEFKAPGQLIPNQAAKMDCFIFYFTERCRQELSGGHGKAKESIQVVRCWLPETERPKWKDSKTLLCDLEIKDDIGCGIEASHGTLQLDFAHKLIGGGVLGHGCVQEEIRFAICPELLAARVVCECLGPLEAVLISGARQFSSYSGYGSTFLWTEPHDNPRRDVCVLAIDAHNFNTPNTSSEQQFFPYWANREVNKAFVGFRGSKRCHLAVGHSGVISTGNWGCGVFGGHLQFKALLQLCAASQAQRPVRYHTFGNPALAIGLQKVWNSAREKKLTVGDVYTSLLSFQEALESDTLIRTMSSSAGGPKGMEPQPDSDTETVDADTEDMKATLAEPLDVFSHMMNEMA